MAGVFRESGTDATRDLTFWSSTAGTVASATDQARTGPCSIKFSTGSPAVAAVITVNDVMADAGRRVQMAFRIDTIPASISTFLSVLNAALANVCIVRLNTDGKLRVVPTGATAVDGSTVVTTNAWHVLTLSYTITNTTTFRFEVWLDGVLEATATAGTMSTVTGVHLRVTLGTGFGINANLWVDDVVVDDLSTYGDLGDLLVSAERPFANGTTNGFTTQIGSGGSGYGTGHAPQVNEQPLSVTNGWSMVGVGAAVTEEYNIETPAAGAVNVANRTPVDVAGWVYAAAVLAETAKIIVDGTQTNIALTNTNTLFVQASATPTVYPAGSGADIGIVTDTTATTVSLFECGILVVTRRVTNFFLGLV